MGSRGKAGRNDGEMQEADEMSTEVMENAANAAAKRREIRNRRILMDPEARMRKLTGYNNANQAAGQMPPSHSNAGDCMTPNMNNRSPNGLEMELDLLSRTPLRTTHDHHYDNQFTPSVTSDTSPIDPNLTALLQTVTGLAQTVPESGVVPQPSSSPQALPNSGFTRVRWLLVLLLGIVIRVSLIYSLGRRFIQSIINPFVFIEIAFLGYQRGIGMELGSGIRGGMWLSVLVLSGIKPEIIDSYKVAMAIVTAIIDDFSLYFFAFVIVHLVCMPFA